MATFTSKASGNWSSSGQTTWNEAGVPGDGDTVTVTNGHTITINQDIGSVGGGGIGTIMVGSTDTATNAKLLFDAAANRTVVFTSASGINVRQRGQLLLNGTSSNKLTIRTTTTDGSTYWRIWDATFTYVTIISLSNCIFQNMGTPSNIGLQIGNPSSLSTVINNIENNHFIGCQRIAINLTDANVYTGKLTFKNNIVEGATGNQSFIYATYVKGFDISGNVFGTPSSPYSTTAKFIYINSTGATYSNNNIYNNLFWGENNSDTIYINFPQNSQIYGNVLHGEGAMDGTTGDGIHLHGTAQCSGWSVYNNYVSGNAHNYVVYITGDTIDGIVHDNFSANGGNEEIYHADGNNTSYYNNIAARHNQVGPATSLLIYNGTGIKVYNNTIDSNLTDAGSSYKDSCIQIGNYGISKSVQNIEIYNNIQVNTLRNGIVNKNVPMNTWSILNNNNIHNASNKYWQINNNATEEDATATLKGSADISIDPIFIDKSKKLLAHHSGYLGGTPTDVFWYNQATDRVAGYDITSLLGFLRSMWAATDMYLQSTGYSGASIGAVPPIPGGKAMLPAM